MYCGIISASYIWITIIIITEEFIFVEFTRKENK